MDFRQDKHNGIIEAFITFWLPEPTDRHTEVKLREDGEKLLKDCHCKDAVRRTLDKDRTGTNSVVEQGKGEIRYGT